MTASHIHDMLRNKDTAVFNDALQGLTKLPVADGVILLEQLACETDVEYRCRAVYGMSLISPERAETLALSMLSDPHGSVRWNACEALWEIGSKTALPQLERVLATDPDSFVRTFVAFALGELGDESFLPILMNAVENDPGVDHEGVPIRETATKAIWKIRTRAGNGNIRSNKNE